MEKENLTREQLLELVEELEIKNENLETENKKLKQSRRRKTRSNIKTTPEEIIDYWEQIEDECDLSIDWSEAHERCWRCGCERKLQRCHIIPDSLGGKDEPSNLVLLCERCHIDAPNVESKTFMWDWIRSNGTSFYDTFWGLRAQKEYEFIYKKSYIQELIDRDILYYRDFERFTSLPIGRSVNHFGHPWKNDSTEAGLLRMRLEAYDKKYPNKKRKSFAIRMKEINFNDVVGTICNIAKEYKWNVWEGRTQNPFSVTISVFLERDKKMAISIKLCRGNRYKAFVKIDDGYEINPNNNKASDYTIDVGDSESDVECFVREHVEAFSKLYGLPEKRWFSHTIDKKFRFWKEEE